MDVHCVRQELTATRPGELRQASVCSVQQVFTGADRHSHTSPTALRAHQAGTVILLATHQCINVPCALPESIAPKKLEQARAAASRVRVTRTAPARAMSCEIALAMLATLTLMDPRWTPRFFARDVMLGFTVAAVG